MKFLTFDHLKRRGWSVANRCYLVIKKNNQLTAFSYTGKSYIV